MKDIIYVTGHKNPDSDSICASIAYADFKNKTGNIPAVPVRLGELSRETNFILDYFGVKPPEFIDTVKVQVSDLNIDVVSPVSPQISLKTAWNIMKKNNVKTLPVVDEGEKLIGIASLSNLTSTYMDVWDNEILSKSKTKLENILDTLSAKIIYAQNESIEFKGKVITAAMQPSSTKDLIEDGDIVICGDRSDTQEIIINHNASLMVVTGGHEIEDKIIEKAKEKGCAIISTPYDTFTTSRLINQSVPISYVMTKEKLICFKTDDFVEDIKDVMLDTRYRSYPVVDSTNKVVGSISRYHLISQNKKKVILVDHNEKTQSVHGLDDAEILEIIDHHRIADIQTAMPIIFRNEPVGSTSTIIASIYFENGLRPPKKIAGILAAAIISDTLLFKSPTSTNIDRLMLKRLAEIANINVDDFASEMFKAGTSLKGRTVDSIFHQDFKRFTLGKYNIGVSQVNTMDIESFNEIKNEMGNLMNEKASKESYDLLVLMVTDILKGGSELLAVGKEKEIIPKAFNAKMNGNSVYLPGVISRKKQVIPPISNVFAMEKKL